MNALFINGGRRSVWREMKRKFGSLTASSSSSSSDTCNLWYQEEEDEASSLLQINK